MTECDTNAPNEHVNSQDYAVSFLVPFYKVLSVTQCFVVVICYIIRETQVT